MSDESSAAIAATRKDWVAEHREMYLKSGGAEGHIMDITPVGGRSFATHCLIKYKGRKSGKIFITALCYGDIAGEVVIVGSKGGADTHPEWYLNILAEPEVEFQIATQAFRATYCRKSLGGTAVYGPGIYLADTRKEASSYGPHIVEFTFKKDTDYLDLSNSSLSSKAVKAVGGGGKQVLLAEPALDMLLRVTQNYYVLRTPYHVSTGFAA